MNWKPNPKRAPVGWGLDSLTDALNSARENQYATFHGKAAVGDLTAIDRVLVQLLEGRRDPHPLQPIQFLLRAHSCYRAAASCAMAGQVYEATVLQRAVLEAAAYGLYIGDDIDRGIMWLRRDDSGTSRDKVRKAFGFGSLKHDFETRHPDLVKAFVELYDTLVDFGGHPNEAGFSISTNIREGAGEKIIDTVYLHDDSGIALNFGIKNTARVGLWIILVFRSIYPDLFAGAGASDAVDELLSRH